jgi:thiamine biosynthesis lipoprotein
MGTVFTIDVRDPGDWRNAVAEAVSWLRHAEAIFSTYQPDSDISRLRRGELAMEATDPWVPVVLDLCAELQLATRGHFTAVRDGHIDPTGLVKGWAVERASAILTRHGARNHAVNGGGDVQLAGAPEPGRPWCVGISHPFDRSSVVATVSGREFAVATSGSAERGLHIVDPFSGRTPKELASATVVGPSLACADAYATAAFVMGREAVRWIAGVDQYEALLVTADGTILRSPAWPVES